MRTETRKRVKSILGFILCCVAIFTSCKVQNNEQISLNSGWEYSLEENGNYV